MSTLRVNTLQDATGSNQPAMVGAAKAWVNFDGTGTPSIRQAFNVSSITDNGTGDYTINFTNAMVDTSYSVCGTSGAGSGHWAVVFSPYTASIQTTSSMRFRTFGSASTLQDQDFITASIFR